MSDQKNKISQKPQHDAEQGYNFLKSCLVPKREQEAEQQLLLFLEKFPEFALAHNDLGVISHKLGKLENAGIHYRKAVQLTPANITFRKNLADFIFVIEGHPEKAMIHYHEVLKLNPKDTEALMMIGNLCLSLGSTEEARNFFNLVSEIEPGNIDASLALEKLDESAST